MPDEPPTSSRGRHFQFRLRTAFLVTTVLCLFLAVPAVAWLLGYVTAYLAVSILAVAMLLAIQLPFYLLFQAFGWLPSPDESEAARGDIPARAASLCGLVEGDADGQGRE